MTESTLIETLASGLHWLYETEQPNTAVLQHHGEQIHTDDNRHYRFIPAGAANRPVVVVNVTHWQWVGEFDIHPEPTLAATELEDLVEALRTLGVEVSQTWNGRGITGSVGLVRPAHPTLLAAVDRYTAGCQTHPTRSVFCDCGWNAGSADVVHLTRVDRVQA